MITANQLKYDLLLYFDKMFEYGAPSYDDKQISRILSKAQTRVFRRYYKPSKDGYKAGFESSEDTRSALKELLRSASISNGTISASSSQIGVHPEGTFYDLPEGTLYLVEEAATTAETSGEVWVKPITHDEYINVRNPYKTPYKYIVWRMDFSREDHGEDGGDSFTGLTQPRVELIVKDKATYPITDYRIRYLSTPSDIVCDELVPANQRHCILDEMLKYEIIDEAYKIATGATNIEEYQIANAENSEN